MKRTKHLRVPVFTEEETFIQEQATETGNSVAAYLRKLGMNYQIHSVLDNQRVRDLLKINADLGRLGGLLKIWLTQETQSKKEIIKPQEIRSVLRQIEANQAQLKEIAKTVLKKKN